MNQVYTGKFICFIISNQFFIQTQYLKFFVFTFILRSSIKRPAEENNLSDGTLEGEIESKSLAIAELNPYFNDVIYHHSVKAVFLGKFSET
jgi:hypothetical protein